MSKSPIVDLAWKSLFVKPESEYKVKQSGTDLH